jgi:hypothetical protein
VIVHDIVSDGFLDGSVRATNQPLWQWRQRSNTVPRLHQGKGQLKRKRTNVLLDLLCELGFSVAQKLGKLVFYPETVVFVKKVSHRVMATSRTEGIQHEIVLSVVWGLTGLSATGLPTDLSAIRNPIALPAIQRPTGPVGRLDADRSLVGADRLLWRALTTTCVPRRPISP